MGRLDDLEPLGRNAIAIARDHEALERTVPGVFERFGHGSGGLPGADDHGPALGPWRQVRGHANRGEGRLYGSVEHRLEQLVGLRQRLILLSQAAQNLHRRCKKASEPITAIKKRPNTGLICRTTMELAPDWHPAT